MLHSLLGLLDDIEHITVILKGTNGEYAVVFTDDDSKEILVQAEALKQVALDKLLGIYI